PRPARDRTLPPRKIARPVPGFPGIRQPSHGRTGHHRRLPCCRLRRFAMVTEGKWPWRADSPLERRSRVAQIYRHALENVAPEDCAALDAQMIAAGQPWVVPN